MFAQFGVPFSLQTDKGPQFVSGEFEAFLRMHGVEHRTTTLYGQPLTENLNAKIVPYLNVYRLHIWR